MRLLSLTLSGRQLHMRMRFLTLLLMLTIGVSQGVAADRTTVTPFPTSNQSPLIQVFGLPFAESARLTPPRHLQAQLITSVANNFTSNSHHDEDIALDGETYRATFSFRYGVSERIELGLDIPYVRHVGGVFDVFIDFWHNSFDLPDGGRDKAPRNRLLYAYRRHGRTEVLVDDDTAGLGDVTLSAAWRLYRDKPHATRSLSLRLNLKLPTGSHRNLRGSGSTDVALRLAGEDRAILAAYRVGLFASAGLLWMREGNVLPAQQRHITGFGMLGAAWDLLSWLVPKMQVNWHAPFFGDSDLRQLASWSAQLTIGTTFRLSARSTIDFAIFEDIVVATSPDVGFQLVLRHLF